MAIPPEQILEPDLPIIDAHHHLWYVPREQFAAMGLFGKDCASALGRIYDMFPRYLFDDFLADLNSGHNICATVYIEVHSMFRTDGPDHLRSVGEIEFANGMAAMGASGTFGETRTCAGIIGAIDFTMGDAVREVLDAHIAAGNGRYKGGRSPGVSYDPALPELNAILYSRPDVLAEPKFREGFRHLGELGLHYEAWVLEPQLADVADLAKAFPEIQIVLNHMGGLIGFGPYRHDERFPIWKRSIAELAELPNVAVKLGGVGNPLCAMPASTASPQRGSRELADEWRPYVETCIEAFGTERALFESNFPVDGVTAPYATVWNAFKRITDGASAAEKDELYFANANRIYRLGL